MKACVFLRGICWALNTRDMCQYTQWIHLKNFLLFFFGTYFSTFDMCRSWYFSFIAFICVFSVGREEREGVKSHFEMYNGKWEPRTIIILWFHLYSSSVHHVHKVNLLFIILVTTTAIRTMHVEKCELNFVIWHYFFFHNFVSCLRFGVFVTCIVVFLFH